MHTLSVRFASKKERDHMWLLLQSFDWGEPARSEEGAAGGWTVGENLGLPARVAKHTIGMRTPEAPQWVWAVAAWMAQRSTHRIYNWGVVYHDDEEIPVIQNSLQHGNDVLVLDATLKLLAWRDRDLPRGPDHVWQQNFIDRLNSVWDSMSPPKRR